MSWKCVAYINSASTLAIITRRFWRHNLYLVSVGGWRYIIFYQIIISRSKRSKSSSRQSICILISHRVRLCFAISLQFFFILPKMLLFFCKYMEGGRISLLVVTVRSIKPWFYHAQQQTRILDSYSNIYKKQKHISSSSSRGATQSTRKWSGTFQRGLSFFLLLFYYYYR